MCGQSGVIVTATSPPTTSKKTTQSLNIQGQIVEVEMKSAHVGQQSIVGGTDALPHRL